MIVAVSAAGTSLLRLRRVRGAVSFDVQALTLTLGRTADAARLADLRDELRREGQSWESELVAVALEAHDPAERARLVNEVLGDVSSALGWGSRIPVVAARISAVGALCVLFFALATRSVGLADIVPVIAWGASGVLAALAVGREADRVSTEARKSVDEWVTRVLDAAKVGSGPPEGSRVL